MAKYNYTSKYHKNNESSGLSPIAKTRLGFGSILLATLFFAMIAFPTPSGIPGSSWFNQFYPHLGLDLQGGTHLVYQADTSFLAESEKSDALEGVRDVIERRVNAYGVAEPVVQTTRSGGNDRVIVELAGVTDVNEAIKLIGETPLLEFKEISNEPLDQNEDTPSLPSKNEEAQKLATELLNRALAGEDFSELAKEYSEDPGSRLNGGDLDFASRGLFVPEFDRVLFDELKDGEIYNEVVETAFGFHVIKRVESRLNANNEEEVRGQHILIARETVDQNSNINWQNTELTGKNLKKAVVNFNQQTGTPYVTLTFDSEGADMFEAITERNVGQQVAIFLDGDIISSPVVQSKIAGGEAQITGSFTLDEAKTLAQRLNAGALPVNIELISQQTVGATLGEVSLQKSLYAGLIGLILIAVFMIGYYRLPGLVAVIALGVYAILSLGLFEMLSITLTLAGIAGFILSVGMAVDANVLIFERMKEELREGETLKVAIERGFSRAWLSIRDSNISSLITTFILFWFGSSIIKGFALTLGLGIIVSMLTAILVSRNIIKLLAQNKTVNESRWLYGVKKVKQENNA